MANVNKAVEAAMVGAVEGLEKKLDEEIERLNNLQDDDLEAIRQRRLAQMKKDAEDRAIWQRNGHGTMHTITEKDFFARAKATPRMIVVFARQGTSRYTNDLQEHFARIAQYHIESLFLNIDAEKAPFLTERFKIRILPSIVMVKDGEIDSVLMGLDHFSTDGKFSTTFIEKKLFDMNMLTDTNIADDV